MRIAAFLSIALIAASPAAAIPARPKSDAYLGCIAAKTAIAMHQFNHGSPKEQGDIAAEIARQGCAPLWPRGLAKIDQHTLEEEAEDIIRRLTIETPANEE